MRMPAFGMSGARFPHLAAPLVTMTLRLFHVERQNLSPLARCQEELCREGVGFSWREAALISVPPAWHKSERFCALRPVDDDDDTKLRRRLFGYRQPHTLALWGVDDFEQPLDHLG